MFEILMVRSVMLGAPLALLIIAVLWLTGSSLASPVFGGFLTLLGLIVLGWLFKFGGDVTGPMILHSPLNRLFIFLVSSGMVIGGIATLWLH
ncbi:MAG: hypothetical protein K2X29_01975 [Candidatus Obscuribacterales bacterium]|nr:hypothetical protein [Candidatus Obscuribacterales bacterium]